MRTKTEATCEGCTLDDEMTDQTVDALTSALPSQRPSSYTEAPNPPNAVFSHGLNSFGVLATSAADVEPRAGAPQVSNGRSRPAANGKARGFVQADLWPSLPQGDAKPGGESSGRETTAQVQGSPPIPRPVANPGGKKGGGKKKGIKVTLSEV